MENLDRRSFLKGGIASMALAASGAALAGCSPAAEATLPAAGAEEIAFDKTADVVIIGAGGAGLMAAVGAHEEAATSILIEKNTMTGGDTALSNQVILGFWPEQQAAAGVTDDSAESYLEDWKKSHYASMKGVAGEELGDTPFSRRLCEEGHTAWQWIAENAGVEWVPSYAISVMMPAPSWDTHPARRWKAQSPICAGVTGAVEQFDDCEIMYGTEVTSLIKNDEGRVVGVRALTDEGTFTTIGANNGVVIATGGFNANASLMAKYIGLNYSRCATGGRPGASGDGLRMAIEAGAATKDITLGSHTFASSMGTYDVWPVHDHMGRYGEFDDALGLTDPAIYINTEGKRFAPESMGYSWAGKHIVEQPNLMAYYVFDSTQPDPELVAYENMILMQDDTLEGLAKSMNVPVDAFVAEVERYNGFVDAGEDADFGKYMNTATKIAVPPFYAIPVITQPYATYGGVMVDIDTHVIDTNGDPIPGLYAAGTVCGISSEQEGLFYCGGVNQGLFYGMVAGQNAANKTEGSHVDIDASASAAAAASYQAGTYTGEGEGMHGTIEVTLTVGDDGAIASVDEITDPGETEGVGGHEAIADGTYAAQIMDAQSADIDGISGATVTSNGVKAAVEAALAQAV